MEDGIPPSSILHPPSSPRASLRIWPLLALLAAAILLRAHHLGAQSYWLDELLSLEASTGRGFADQQLPLDQILHPGHLTSLTGAPAAWKVWTTLQLDSHPPAYYLLLRFWRMIAGDAEAAVRALSVVFSITAVVTLYFLARRLAGPRAALWAAALAAVSPLQVFHAQEARNTAMLAAATLLAALLALRAEERPTPRRFLALGAAVVLAMLTHYLAAGVLLAVAIYLAVRLRGRPLRRAVLTFISAAAVYALIWGPWLYQQRASLGRNHEAIAESPTGALHRALLRAATDPARQLTGHTYHSILLAALITLAFLASLLLLRRYPKLLLAHLWLAVPLLIMVLFDATTNAATLALSRYTFVTAPATFLLLAAAAAALARYAGDLLPAAAALLALSCLPTAYNPWKPDWRALATDLQAARAPAEPILLATPPANRWWLGGAVLGLTHYSPDTTLPIVLLTAPATNPAITDLPSAWIIAHQSPFPPQAYLPNSPPAPTTTLPFIGALAHTTRPQPPHP